MREPQKPTDFEMSVYMLGRIDGFRRLTRALKKGESIYEVWSEGKPHVYFRIDEAEGIFDFDSSCPCIVQIHPDVKKKCEVWLAWKAEQDARMSERDMSGADGWQAEGEMSKERAMIRDMVAAELAIQRGPHGKFREIVRRIVREELARAIDGDMTDISDAIERLRREYSERK